MQNGYKIDLLWVKGTARKVLLEKILQKAVEKGYRATEIIYSFGKEYESSYCFINADYPFQAVLSDEKRVFEDFDGIELSVNNALDGKYPDCGEK